MANETVITVVGNLTADPELRTLNSGPTVANFTIAATPRVYNRQSGQWENGAALFMRCNAWNELANNIAGTCLKGMRVIAQGVLHQRSYKAKDGSDRSIIELTATEIGPSLRYAKAQVVRNAQNGQPQQPMPQQAPAQPQQQMPPQQPPQQQALTQSQQGQTPSNWTGQQAGYSAQGFNNEPAF